ncbi:MAG: fumarylacetoacetate hydrolase family protein [Armatimonadetes bacterium]|nr:fumarylacetoacetate hydrolase family protein [Armatimonadota bacterium]
MEFDRVHPIATDAGSGGAFLASFLQLPNPVTALTEIYGEAQHGQGVSFDELWAAPNDPSVPHLLAPLDLQEVWAAGVTYQRSKVARMEESVGGGSFYDRVYDAARPEIFLKATPSRVSPPGGPVRIRKDALWNVPEPELALLFTPRGKLVGYSIGNDMSSRDIEGENPLYLPQAKVYNQSAALGPVIWLEGTAEPRRLFDITLTIERAGAVAFTGTTNTNQMKRGYGELIDWLLRDNDLSHGGFLMTGTGIVPPDEFTLAPGDVVSIEIEGIGVLRNTVVQG